MSKFFKGFGLLLLLIILAFFSRGKESVKVYDCFTFFNELDLLEVRLNELYDHVDHFVLVEWSKTHQGNPKPFYFDENKERFARFTDKIIHIKMEDELNTADTWVRENFQRNAIMRGLEGCHKDDLILISDLDEIIHPQVIPEMKRILSRGKREYVSTTQKMYMYFINQYRELWHGTVGTTYGNLSQRDPQYFRNRRNKGLMLDNAGWHFTYLGGLKKVVEKLEAFAHAEGNTPEGKSRDHLLAEMGKGVTVPLDNTFPGYVLENEQRFREIGFVR